MRKLSISLIAVVIASIVGLGWILNQIYFAAEQQNIDSETNSSLMYSGDILALYMASEHQFDFVRNWNASSHFQLAIIPLENFPVPQSLHSEFLQGEPLLLESDEGITAHYVLPESEQVLAVALPLMESETESQLELALTLSFYAGVIAIILIWIWPLIYRLIALRDTAKVLGKGDLTSRVKLNRFSYIQDIELEFNRMAERIQSLIEDNKLLSRAVSHDLKTPLARLRFGLDAIADTDDKIQRDKYAKRVNRDMEEMESLVETLLQYARLDENRIQKKEESVDLESFIEAAIYDFDIEDIHIDFRCETNRASLCADKRYLAMLVNNLLGNAVRYAKSKVLVSLQSGNGTLFLSIEDDGKGIPQNEREHVVKPFWRGKTGESKRGHGMGLAIASRIAQWHGAELSIGDSEALGGARVLLSFG